MDTWNEVTPGVFNYLADIDGVQSVPAAPTVGESIGDQLVQAGLSWKTYRLNPGLIQQGDVTAQRLVQAIQASQVWNQGSNAIVIVWDENDYSGLPNAPEGLFPPQNQNNVVLTVELNGSASGAQSGKFYTSFSLLKSLEAGFTLPCLNHACDPSVHVMSDLFGGH